MLFLRKDLAGKRIQVDPETEKERLAEEAAAAMAAVDAELDALKAQEARRIRQEELAAAREAERELRRVAAEQVGALEGKLYLKSPPCALLPLLTRSVRNSTGR